MKKILVLLVLMGFMLTGLIAQSVNMKSIGFMDSRGEIVAYSENDMSGSGYICRLTVVGQNYSIFCAVIKDYTIMTSKRVSGVPVGTTKLENGSFLFYVEGYKFTQKSEGDYLILVTDSLIPGVVFIFSN